MPRLLPGDWLRPFLYLFVSLFLFSGAHAQDGEEIAVGHAALGDDEIESRIQDVYDSMGSLGTVTVQVENGVVILSGTTQTRQAREQAVSVAKRVAGVVSVADGIAEDRDIVQRMRFVLRDLRDRIYQLIAFTPLLAVALVIFFIFWLLARLAVRWDAPFQRTTHSPFLQDLLKQIIRGGILLLGFVVLLQILDATALLGTILGAAGILGLAIGFAIRDTVENYLASILLSLRQPFGANDHVMIEGNEGLVMRLTSRETVLMTLDGNHIRIPNAMVYKSVITNYSRNPRRRFAFDVGVDTAVNLSSARALGVSTLAATPGVLAEPPPKVRIVELGDSNVLLTMLGWVDQDHNDFLKVRSEAIRAVKNAFDAANYEMPEPIYRLKIEGQALPTAESEAQAVTQQPIQLNPKLTTAKPVVLEEKVAADVSREHFIEKQIHEEKQQDGEEDLLSPKQPPPIRPE